MEVAREVNRFLGLVFAQRHKDGRTDLEAVESALRAALHQAGAAALAELLKFDAPAAEYRAADGPAFHCRADAQLARARSICILKVWRAWARRLLRSMGMSMPRPIR
jgi:hypothetical protein